MNFSFERKKNIRSFNQFQRSLDESDWPNKKWVNKGRINYNDMKLFSTKIKSK